MRIRSVLVGCGIVGLSVAGLGPARADVTVVLHDSVNGNPVVDEQVVVPAAGADATVRVANVDASAGGACMTGLGLSITEPAPLARESGVLVACVGTP